MASSLFSWPLRFSDTVSYSRELLFDPGYRHLSCWEAWNVRLMVFYYVRPVVDSLQRLKIMFLRSLWRHWRSRNSFRVAKKRVTGTRFQKYLCRPSFIITHFDSSFRFSPVVRNSLQDFSSRADKRRNKFEEKMFYPNCTTDPTSPNFHTDCTFFRP